MTDEFPLLTHFRSQVPEPDSETTQRIYALAIARQRRTRQAAARVRRSRRAQLAFAVAAIALVLVPTGLALSGKIVDLFEGSPPPAAVTESYETGNRVADAQVKNAIADHFPKANLSKLHGVIQIETAAGPQDLWTAPNDSGGQCFFVDFANDHASASGKAGNGTCDSSTSIAALPSKIDVSEFWLRWHPAISTVYGRVHLPAVSVKLILVDGPTITAPVVESFFLVSLKKTDEVAEVVAYDAAGGRVALWIRPGS